MYYRSSVYKLEFYHFLSQCKWKISEKIMLEQEKGRKKKQRKGKWN